MALFGCWNMSIPVKVNWPIFCDPNGYFLSSPFSLDRNLWFPPHKPSSTCTPIIPSGAWVAGHRRIKVHGQNGDCSKPSCTSSSFRAWNHKNGASMSPYALLVKRHISLGFSLILAASSGIWWSCGFGSCTLITSPSSSALSTLSSMYCIIRRWTPLVLAW